MPKLYHRVQSSRFLILVLTLFPVAAFAQTADPDPLTATLPSGRVVHFETAEQKAKFVATQQKISASNSSSSPTATATPNFKEREQQETHDAALANILDELHFRAQLESTSAHSNRTGTMVIIRLYDRTLKNVPDPAHPLNNLKRYEFSQKTLDSTIVEIRGVTPQMLAGSSFPVLDIYRISEKIGAGTDVVYTVSKETATKYAETQLKNFRQ